MGSNLKTKASKDKPSEIAWRPPEWSGGGMQPGHFGSERRSPKRPDRRLLDPDNTELTMAGDIEIGWFASEEQYPGTRGEIRLIHWALRRLAFEPWKKGSNRNIHTRLTVTDA